MLALEASGLIADRNGYKTKKSYRRMNNRFANNTPGILFEQRQFFVDADTPQQNNIFFFNHGSRYYD